MLDCCVELDELPGCVAAVLLVLAPTLPAVLPALEAPEYVLELDDEPGVLLLVVLLLDGEALLEEGVLLDEG
jgi:hypothetical protein